MEKTYRWFKYINDALKYIGDRNRELLFLSKEISQTQHKKYLVCTYDEFYETMEGYTIGDMYVRPVEEKHRLYHCMIMADTPVLLFMDIESPFAHNENIASEDYLCTYMKNGLVKYMCQLLLETNNIQVSHEKDFIYLTASSEKKFSYHIHCTNEKVVFRDKTSLSNFVNHCFFKYNKELEEYGDTSLYTIREKEDRSTKNIIQYKKEIVDLSVYNVSLRCYGSTKKECANDKNRRLNKYDINAQKRSYTFDLSILKKTMIHNVDKYMSFENMIEFGNGFKKQVKLSRITNESEDTKNTVDLSCFSNFFLNMVNEIIKKLSSKLNKKTETARKITVIKMMYENILIIQLTGKCIISKCLFDKEHHSTSGYRFILNTKTFRIHPACFNSSCTGSSVETLIKNKLTVELDLEHKERINIIFNPSMTTEEKLIKINHLNVKNSELDNALNIYSKSFSDLF